MVLTLTEDERYSLEAALAFVDANYAQTSDEQTSDRRARTRARNSVAAARTHSKRRNELLRLREESAALEATLVVMASRRGSSKRACDGRKQSPIDAVLEEMARLSEAKAMNSRLREACRRQQAAARHMVRVMKRQMDFQCVRDLIREAGATSTAERGASPGDRRSVFLDLRERLRSLASDATALIQDHQRETWLSGSHARLVHHPFQGPVMEVASSTQLACTVSEGWEYFMGTYRDSHLARTNRDAYGLCSQVRQAQHCSADEKEFFLALRGPQRPRPVAVDGLALVETFASRDWKLCVKESVVSIRGEPIRVRERCWVAIAKSTTNACALHQQYELSCTNVAVGKEASASCSMTKFLVESLLLKTRRDQRRAVDVMTERFGLATECLAALFGG